MEGNVVKVFSVKDGKHHYYVQRMPGYWGLGIDYVVMKDRKRLNLERFSGVNGRKQAVGWLLAYLCRQLDQLELDL